MAGHAQQWVLTRTVDYNGGEHSKPIHSEFHHITSAVSIGRVGVQSAFPPASFCMLGMSIV